MKRNGILTALWITLGASAAIAFIWLVLFKLAARLLGGRGAPCPAALGWLVDNPLRRRYMRPVLDRVGLRPGEAVLELGPGPGAFTLEAARRVGPRGRLIAVDIQPAMIARLEEKVRAAGLENVETHVASAFELPLPDSSVDRAFLITVLPEIPDQVRALREVHRVLKPGGILSITEEFYDPDYPRQKTTIAWAAAAGFELVERQGNLWVYTLNFVRARPEATPAPREVGVAELGAVSETLLLPLYFRAQEGRRPDALLRDPRAAELVAQVDYDFSALEGQSFQALNVVLRAREFDRRVRAFLAAHPDGVVVDMGCGLDTRFDRLDNGRVRWFNLDLPEVIRLRARFFAPTSRCRVLPFSALDPAWMDMVAAEPGPYFFLAEGVLPYLEEEEVRGLVRALAERFPGAEFLFDAMPILMARFSRLHPVLRNTRARTSWGVQDSRVLERWGAGARLLSDWRYYEQDEPRLGAYKLLRWVPVLRDFRILHYRLGSAPQPIGDGSYLAAREKLLRDFDRALRRVRALFVARFGAEPTAALAEEARAEYSALIPQMPYLGGQQPFTQFVVSSAWFLALYRVLQRRGLPLEDIGRLIHEVGAHFVQAYPAYVRRLIGRQMFTHRYQEKVRTRAAASRYSPYPSDYQYDWVPGDGAAFDWGVNYTRCAGWEFLRAQGAPELGPYLCAFDALYSDALGWGLIRTKTLAEGGDCCDFRFRQGGPTRVALPPALQTTEPGP